jgi:hypothetical protein
MDAFHFDIPASVDLRHFVTGIRDQGTLGDCVAEAICANIEMMMHRAGNTVSLSPLFLHHVTHDLENNTDYNGGVMPWDGFNAAKESGVAHDSVWPYVIPNASAEPPPSAYSDASQQKVTSWETSGPNGNALFNAGDIEGTIANFRTLLAEGKEVLVTVIAQTWLFHLSGPLDQQQGPDTLDPSQMASNGLHELDIVGMRTDSTGAVKFIVQNSWGTSWGDHGYGLIDAHTLMGMTIFAAQLDGFAGMDFTYTPSRIETAELYTALFGRAPEKSGMQYWSAQLDHGISLAQVAQSMFDCAPSRVLYPTGESSQQMVTSFYQNVLGRTPDSQGLSYWSGKLASETPGQLIDDLINAINGYHGTDQNGVASQHLFENKVAVGMDYAVDLRSDNINLAMQAYAQVTADPNTVEIIKVGLYDQLHGVA